jgi:hypothetical protein
MSTCTDGRVASLSGLELATYRNLLLELRKLVPADEPKKIIGSVKLVVNVPPLLFCPASSILPDPKNIDKVV